MVINQTVIACVQLSGTKTRWHHFRKAGTLHFYFLCEYSKVKTWQAENDEYSWKN